MASNPLAGDSVMSTADGKPMVGDQASHFADLSIVYTTDDPGLTAASALTIADGDGTLVTAEVLQAITDIHAKVNAIIAVLEVHGLMADA